MAQAPDGRFAKVTSVEQLRLVRSHNSGTPDLSRRGMERLGRRHYLSAMRPVRTLLLTAPLLIALAACGSTVEQTTTGAAGDDGLGAVSDGTGGLGSPVRTGGAGTTSSGTSTGGTGGAVATSSTGASTSGAGTSGGGTASGTTGGTTPRTDGATTAPRPTTGGGTPAGPVVVDVAKTGKGWDEQFVYVGITTQNDAAVAAGTLGLKGLDPGNTEKQALAVIDDINAKGGVFGRKLKAVFKDLPSVSTALDPTTAGASTCTFFTQDRPVIGVFNIVTPIDGPTFRSCLAKGRTPLFSGSLLAVDDAVGDSLAPYFVQSLGVSWNALAPALVSSLKAQGYFTGWDVRAGAPGTAPVKVGIIVKDDDVGRRVATLLTSALKSAGYSSSLVFKYAPDSNDQNPTVLAFAGKGVTHVIDTDVSLFLFGTAAENQGYRPRYGLSSYNAPQAGLIAFTPAAQLRGSVGAGWSPGLDMADAQTPALNPAAKQCEALMVRAGESLRNKRLGYAVSQTFCDGLNLFVAAAKASGGLTPEKLGQGLLIAGPRFPSSISFSTALTQGRAFLPGSYRGFGYDPVCSCYKYTTGVTAF